MDIIHVDPHTFARVQQNNQPIVVYKCQLQGVPIVQCGEFLEGTRTAISAHLHRHNITSSDGTRITCPWGSCSKSFKWENMARHILTHMGVKARCSVCGVVMCRPDVLRAHIKSSEQCHFASCDVIHGPEGRYLVGPVGTATYQFNPPGVSRPLIAILGLYSLHTLVTREDCLVEGFRHTIEYSGEEIAAPSGSR